MRLHTKLSPSECIERLQQTATRKEVVVNPRYRLPDGVFRFETRVDGQEFYVYSLSADYWPLGRERRHSDSPTTRSFHLSGNIASHNSNGGSVITARLPWTQFLFVGLILLALLAVFVFIVLDFPARQSAYLAPYPKLGPLHEHDPRIDLAIVLVVFPVSVFGLIYGLISIHRLFTDFLRDLLEAG